MDASERSDALSLTRRGAQGSSLAAVVLALAACGTPPDRTAASQATSSALAPSASAAPPPVASPGPSADVDACEADGDCVYSQEDECCNKTPCREDARAETRPRAERRHEQCARKDCMPAKDRPCSADDTRRWARCVDRRCVVAR